MKLRPLVIDDEARNKVMRVLAYAKEHPYHAGDPIPGNNPNFVVHLDTYRCVFTYTESSEKEMYRHLSLSVPTLYPNPIAAFTIAELFGFTGWDGHTIDRAPDSWMVKLDEVERCIAIFQVLDEPQSVH